MKNYSKCVLSVGLVSLLIGCGSSSSSTTDFSEANQTAATVTTTDDLVPSSTNSTPTTEMITLKGIAVDDLIVDGVVKVYAPDAPEVILAEGRTDSERGTYSLNIDYDGVVVLDVSADERTKMKNPETGEIRESEPDLRLHSAAVVSSEIEEIEVNVSPLTDLVVSQMNAQGATPEALESAQDSIGKIFGFDPLGDSPLENESYAKTVTAIRDLADAKGVSIVEVIEELNEDTIDGTTGDDGTIAQELATIMEEQGVLNTFTENDGVVTPEETTVAQEETVDVEDDVVPVVAPIYTVPTVTTSSIETDIEVSKAFFDDLRTQTMSVIDYDDTGEAGFLDTESEELGEGLENMALNIDLVADYSMGIVDLIGEAVDEGVDTKSIEMDEREESTSDSSEESEILEKGGEPVVSRTLEVTRTEDPTVWLYTMEENTSLTYEGKVTLSESNISSITASNFTTLSAKFEGTLPLRYMDSLESVGEQNVTLDLAVDKRDFGADVRLSKLLIQNGVDSISVENLNGKLEYSHDLTTDEVTLQDVQIDTLTLKATLESYTLEGKLDLSSYVTNQTIADKGFEGGDESFETEIRGQIQCAGEYNETITLNNMSGNVIYTDQFLDQHMLSLNDWGDFYERLEGNLQNLSDGERLEANSFIYDSNSSIYLGIDYPNLDVSSESCNHLVIEELFISVMPNWENSDLNQTEISLHLSCLNNGILEEVTDATGTFTDATGVEHTFSRSSDSLDYFQLRLIYDGNTEGLVFNSGFKSWDIQGGETFDRIEISDVNSECQNPALSWLNVWTEVEDHGDGEQFYTKIEGGINCDDNDSVSIPTQATVLYRDPEGNEYTLLYNGNQFSNETDIIGNVEGIELNRGEEHYHALGYAVKMPSFFSTDIDEESCPVPTLNYYMISLNSDRDDDIYNSGVLPEKLTFVGDIINTKTNGEVNGVLSVEWKNVKEMNLTHGSDATAELDVTLQGHIKMPDRPEMIINLGYANNVEDNVTDLSLSYQYDTTVLNGIGSLDEAMENGILEFTGTNGIKLVVTLENGETVYGEESPVTRNGRKIGELQDRAGVPVISYVDGTFESLP